MLASEYTADEIGRIGQELYDREIRQDVEPEFNDKFLVLDIVSGAYAIADDDLAATDQVFVKNPDAVTYGVLIGSPTAYYIGGHRSV
jgi:hypothetical protein